MVRRYIVACAFAGLGFLSPLPIPYHVPTLRPCIISGCSAFLPPIMNRFFQRATQPSDDVILAPPSINPCAKDQPEFTEFKYCGKEYIRCHALTKGPKQLGKKRPSKVWDWGEDIQLKSGNGGLKFYFCYLCEKSHRQQDLLVINKGTSNALDHLEKLHNVDRASGLIKTCSDKSQPTLRTPSGQQSLEFQSNFNCWKQLFIQWIVYCHIAFYQIENGYFRRMLFYLVPKLSEWLPQARKTIRTWVLEEFKIRKGQLIKDIANACSAIHILFDLWTSPNALSTLAVVAHFIDCDGKKRHKLLALREVFGEHSGENIAAICVAVIKEYKFKNRFGVCIGDNADSNNTATELILKALFPRMSARKRKQRRIRCFGHIVNLCAQAFIVGQDCENVSKEIDRATQDMDFKKVRELWKKQGAIGLFQNLIRYIRASPQRRQFFKSLKVGDEFDELEVGTIFHMLKHIMVKELWQSANIKYSRSSRITKHAGIHYLLPSPGFLM